MAENFREELYHHGILGQKWGVQNGPPYPLGAGKLSRREKRNAKTIKKAVANQTKKLIKVEQKVTKHTLKNHPRRLEVAERAADILKMNIRDLNAGDLDLAKRIVKEHAILPKLLFGQTMKNLKIKGISVGRVYQGQALVSLAISEYKTRDMFY